MNSANRSLFPVVCLVLLGVVLVHLPALRTGYAYDDVEAILENPDLRRWDRAPALFATNYWGSRNIGLYRPLVQLSYLVDGAGSSFDARVSHGIQLGLHLGVVALLLVLLVELGVGVGQASVVSLLFGVHPALLDASVWISGRTDVLSALFTLSALLLALRAGRRREGFLGWRTLAAAMAFLLGLLSKEMAVTVPLLVLLLPGTRPRRRLPALVVAFLVYLLLRWTAVPGVLPAYAGDGEGVLLGDRGLLSRVVVGARACLRLLALLFVPVGLAADHRAHPWAQPDVTLRASGFVAVVVVTLWAVWGWRRRRLEPAEGFLALGALVSLLPILQIIPIGAVMAERFLYTPALFALPLVTRVLARAIPGRRLRRALAGVALVLLVVVTEKRIPVYADRGAYDTDVIRAYAQDWKAWNNLGVYRYLPLPDHESHEPDFDGADAAFTRATELRPRYRRGTLNRARARLERQRLKEPNLSLEDVEEWLAPWAERGDADAHYLLGKVAWRSSQRAKDPTARAADLERAYARHRAAAKGFERAGRVGRRAAAAWKEAGLASRQIPRDERWRDAWTRALEHDGTISGAAAMTRALRSAEDR